jgi:hypothetical protein
VSVKRSSGRHTSFDPTLGSAIQNIFMYFMVMNKSPVKKLLVISSIILGIIIAGAYPVYLLSNYCVTRYFTAWAGRLVDLENRGLLSQEFGAGWQDVLAGQTMEREAHRIAQPKNQDTSRHVRVVDGIVCADYPSLSIIERLREIRTYSNTIEITDRVGRPLAAIKTDHSRARIHEFPAVLLAALIAAEDQTFRTNALGFEFGSFVRAGLRAAVNSVLTLHRQPLRGTSTITQQTAKLFISRLDAAGRRHVSRSIDRKLRELRLAAALRRRYAADDILEVYCNHCVTSDYGLVGYKDIAEGLFNKELSQLSDAQCIYLSRMVKWGRNVRSKITAQCRLDMPRMGRALGWDARKQREVLGQIDTLTFTRPAKVDAVYGPLVDLANEFWLLTLRQGGFSREQTGEMDLIDPASLIRKKGNLKISLTIDAPLQKALERLVNGRGYGPDTVVTSERCIAASDTVVTRQSPPRDTVHAARILREPVDIKDTSSAAMTCLNAGDTVFVTVTYKKTGPDRYCRSAATRYRRTSVMNGQYYAYGIMDSRSGKLLAYYSKDRLGSRLACLLRNRTPNGSSTAKPIFNALNFDLGTFAPYQRWNDRVEVLDSVPWKRTIEMKHGTPWGAVFLASAVRGKGYTVHNHNNIFEGCQYLFDLLASSNNILGVESVYRLNRRLYSAGGEISPDAFPLVQYCYRIGALAHVRDTLRLRYVTGVRAYKELVRAAGVDVDSIAAAGNRALASDSMYSVALGTLELSLYEQMHLFNILYRNDLIERPAEHPSLVLRSVVCNGDTMAIADTVRRCHPFSDIENLRPTWLGMHKRLVSNAADGLADFDIALPPQDSAVPDSVSRDGNYHFETLTLRAPPANFAKSGTSDDCIKPFDAPAGSGATTNYGLWNAVIRVNLAALSGDSVPDIRDITVACIGECNQKYTGPRDGKTLHKYLTAGLLKEAGIRSPNGFYARYEEYLRKVTPASENCGAAAAPSAAAMPVIDKRGD